MDSKAAIDVLVTGAGRDDAPRRLAGLFWQAARYYEIIPWLEYTKSSLNVSDAPSRCCGEQPPMLDARVYSVEKPPLRFAALVSSEEALRTAVSEGVDALPVKPCSLRCP